MGNLLRAASFACAIMLMGALAGCSGAASSSAQPSSASSAASSVSAASVASASSASQQAASSEAQSAQASTGTAEGDALAPGVYSAVFDTDSSMFHVNEANEGRGELIVEDDGSMTIHVALVSKKITNLYPGTADQAKADEAGILQPTTDKVTYSDGYEEEVYGFNVPVPAIGEEFDVAILGEKGSWYDHKVIVSDPIQS